MTSQSNDPASRFVYILKGKRQSMYLLPEDFMPLVQDVVDTHPGLSFLKEAAEFHSRYINTVIARIFYVVNRSWTGRITVQEIRRSNLLQVIIFSFIPYSYIQLIFLNFNNSFHFFYIQTRLFNFLRKRKILIKLHNILVMNIFM